MMEKHALAEWHKDMQYTKLNFLVICGQVAEFVTLNWKDLGFGAIYNYKSRPTLSTSGSADDIAIRHFIEILLSISAHKKLNP